MHANTVGNLCACVLVLRQHFCVCEMCTNGLISVSFEQGRWTAVKKVYPEDLPDSTVAKVCSVYLVDYCCFGYPLPEICVTRGISCDARNEFDVLNVHWLGMPSMDGQAPAHLYHSEAAALKDLHKLLKP